MSTDPINSANPNRPGSWNKYAYALNNPVVLVDPDGRKPGRAPVIDEVQYKKYVAQRFAKDTGHKGPHWHVYERRGHKLLGRVSVATGEMVDDGHVPNRMIRHLRKIGKIGGRTLGILGSLLFTDELNADEPTDEQWEMMQVQQQESEQEAEQWEDFFDLEEDNEPDPDDEEEEERQIEMAPRL